MRAAVEAMWAGRPLGAGLGRACRFSLTLLLLLCAATVSPTWAETWDYHELSLSMGSGDIRDGALYVQPDAYGKAFLTIPAGELQLQDYPLVTIEFAEPPEASRLLFIWQGMDQTQSPRQVGVPRPWSDRVNWSMAGNARWSGQASMVGLGVYMQPGQTLAVRSISLHAPTALTPLWGTLNDWLAFRPWHAADVNAIAGTSVFNRGLAPVPVFALLAFALVAVYLALVRFKPGGAVSWQVVGLIVLCCWIALDAFWQLRLLRQVQLTADTFAGRSNEEKLLVSEDRQFVQFAGKVKAAVSAEPSSRIFLASAMDGNGMRLAYYLSPLNTYWHRRGPELPAPEWLQSDSYVLLQRPSQVDFQAQRQVLVVDGEELPVEVVLEDTMGVLLRIK